jgi:hypothetical protein
MTLTLSMRCGLLGGVMAIVAMLSMSPVHANSYDYTVQIQFISSDNQYDISGEIITNCNQCLIGPSDVLFWQFNEIGPGVSWTLSSVYRGASAITVSGLSPLYALSSGQILFDPLAQNGSIEFSDTGRGGGLMGFAEMFNQFVNEFTGNVVYAEQVGPNDYNIQNQLQYDLFHEVGGEQIATLAAEFTNNYHPSPRREREILREELENTVTPLPAALPLFATGLGAMGLLGWRRKRKNAATIAAA